MSKATFTHTPTPTKEQIDHILDTIADSFARQLRSPIMHAPSEQNFVYEEGTYPLAGMNQPSSGTPSSAGNRTSSQTKFCPAGACITAQRSCRANESAIVSSI